MKQHIPWKLIIAALKNELSDEDQLRLNQWTATDTNRKIYDELSQLWLEIQEQTAEYTPDKEYYWQKLNARMHKEGKKEKSSLKNKRFRMLRYVAAACIVLMLLMGGATYWVVQDANKQGKQEVCFSSLGGKSQVTLADGTKVWLHSNTTLSYRQQSRSDKREVKMTGEAFFEVAHDAEHPFVIQMNGMKLTVYGTKFNVRDLSESDQVEVSLQEGSVGLETSYENRKMYPGDKALFNKTTNKLLISSGDVGFDVSWAQKQMVFNQNTLGFICRYLSRWYNVDIVLDPALKDKYRYTFTLRDESLEEIMRLISRVNPVYYYFDEENKLFINRTKK